MSKFQKLAQINKIANECVQDGDFVLASKFHNEFLKIAQIDDAKDIFNYVKIHNHGNRELINRNTVVVAQL